MSLGLFRIQHFLLLCGLLIGQFVWAETTTAPQESVAPPPASASPQEQCVWMCNQVVGSSQASSVFATNCKKALEEEKALGTLYGQAQNIAKIVDQALFRCLPSATVKAVTGIPEFVMGLPALTYQVASSIYNSIDQSEAARKAELCYQSMDCRKGMMRQMFLYRDMNSDGTFKVSDEQMLGAMKDVDFNTLWVQSRFQFEGSRDECFRELHDARVIAMQAHGELTPALQRQIYNQIAKEKTFCIGVLQIKPPELEPRLQTQIPSPVTNSTPRDSIEGRLANLSLGEKLAVGKACLGDKFDDAIVNFCADIVSVVVPVPLVGPQSRVIKAEKGAVTSSQTVADEVATKTAVGLGDEAAAIGATAATSSAMIRDYKGLVISSGQQNAEFIAIATKANAGALNPARTRFFTAENTMMKFLNSAIPKEMVTALTNFHKQKLDEQLDILRAKYEKLYPGIKLNLYSDFKSMHMSIQTPTNMTPAMHQQLYNDLNAAFATANSALTQQMKLVGLDTAALRAKALATGVDPKVASDPQLWFRGGFGATPDETNIAARMARASTETNQLIDFTASGVQQNAEVAMAAVESQRLYLSQQATTAQLMVKNERGFLIPRADVFDLVRKSRSAEDLVATINLRYKNNPRFKPITLQDAKKLREYVAGVNEFNPAIFIPERQVISLDSAKDGAASADFLGLGAENYMATASGLAGQTRVGEGLTAVRSQEQVVTQLFQQRQKRFDEIVGGAAQCSGDDCIKIFPRQVSVQEKARLMDNLAADPQARRVRVSFIGPGVAQEHRLMLATHGEEIEKALRSSLEGKIPYDKLGQLTFGLDMTSSQLNQGWVNLMIGKPRGVRLSSAEQEMILESFESSIQKFNQTNSQYAAGSASANVLGVQWIVGPSLIMGSSTSEPE